MRCVLCVFSADLASEQHGIGGSSKPGRYSCFCSVCSLHNLLFVCNVFFNLLSGDDM